MSSIIQFFTDGAFVQALANGMIAFFVIVVMIVVAFGMIVGVLSKLFGSAQSIKKKKKITLSIEDLGKQLEFDSMQLKKKLLNTKAYQKLQKDLKKKQKALSKKETKQCARVFVIDFNGDIKASQAELLRKEVSAVLEVADVKTDEVLVRIESPGGAVSGYGLAASQLQRIRDKKLSLIVSVDKVAASGGYLMACVANKIVCAPFAVVGSIGVIFSIPNFHRFLKKKDIDYEQLTAGEFKRTVTMFGEVSEKARKKRLQELEEIHTLFKDHVKHNRPSLDVAKVSTGEYWFGTKAKELNLVDEVMTSDDYILQSLKEDKKIYHIQAKKPKHWAEKFQLGMLASGGLSGLLSKNRNSSFDSVTSMRNQWQSHSNYIPEDIL